MDLFGECAPFWYISKLKFFTNLHVQQNEFKFEGFTIRVLNALCDALKV